MTSPAADEEPVSGRRAVIEALAVPRYARLAVVVAAVFTLAVVGYFVGFVAQGQTQEPLGYYLALAFVIFVTTAMLALAVLVGRRVLALSVHPAGIVRTAATSGVIAGVLWLAAAVGLLLGPAQPWATVVDVAAPWAPLFTPVGLWAVYTRYKRTAALRPVAALATVVALAGALAVADLAAVELIAMLPDVGRPVNPATVELFQGAAIALVGGQVGLALLAALGDGDVVVPGLLAIVPLAGLAGYLALDAGRLGLCLLAAGMGAGWLLAGWRLRGVRDADVPAGPDRQVTAASNQPERSA